MKKIVIVLGVVIAAAGIAYYTGMFSEDRTAQAAGPEGAAGGAEGRGGRRGGGGFPGGAGGFGGGGGFGRPPMTVELGAVSRKEIAAEITLVGNLIGEATVAVAPRAAGRLQDISVRLGDRVNRGQRLAQIEDFEIKEQVKQAEAAQDVSQATIRQREADLQLALTSVERSRNLYQRQLLPKQTLDDNEARYQSALASVDLAKAQSAQSRARLDELRINLANTVITSPVTGFIARRAVDPGAFVGQNAPIVDVVDITRVRLVANVVEKDLTELQAGDTTRVEVDAFPGETFSGRIARVSPVLDPATRTAPIEVEIPNPDFRLRPGMYARVRVVTDTTKNALVVPANAVVDLGGRRGVFVPLNSQAVFRTIQIGAEQQEVIEVLGGVDEGEQVITTGAGALRDGDRVLLPGGGQGGGRRGGRDGAAAGNGQQFGGPRGDGGAAGTGSSQRSDVPEAGARGAEGRGQFAGRGRRGAPPAQ
jgi:membrane fusion protein, multidrug efflux system